MFDHVQVPKCPDKTTEGTLPGGKCSLVDIQTSTSLCGGLNHRQAQLDPEDCGDTMDFKLGQLKDQAKGQPKRGTPWLQ